MKLSVTKGFIDKDTNIFHNVGQIVEYPEKRAKEIETSGFGKILNEPKPTTAEPKAEPKETPAKPKKVATKKK